MQTTVVSYIDEETDFIGLVDVRDPNGITVFLAWQSLDIDLAPKGVLIPDWRRTIFMALFENKVWAVRDLNPRPFD